MTSIHPPFFLGETSSLYFRTKSPSVTSIRTLISSTSSFLSWDISMCLAHSCASYNRKNDLDMGLNSFRLT